MPHPSRAVLIDRDGTLIENVPYLGDPEKVTLIPGAADALIRLQRAGWMRVVISNQSGIGRGLLADQQVRRVNEAVARRLARAGASFDGWYYCPHTPDAACDCRKPADGLVRRAARELGFDPSAAVMIGDNHADMELAEALGIRGWLVRTGHGADAQASWRGRADIRVVDDFPAAVAELLADDA